MVAFEQIWMMIELCIRIRQPEGSGKSIQTGRTTVIVIEALFFTSIVIASVYFLAAVNPTEDKDRKLQFFRKMGLFFATLFGALFVILAFVVCLLIRSLWVRNKQVK